MAWLELQPSGIYHIAFRLGDQRFKKSLHTKSPKYAEARRQRLEENLRLVEAGRLSIAEDGDVTVFLLSDGKLNGVPKAPERLELGKLFAAYKQTLPRDAMEPESLRVAGVHMGHFTRLLGSRLLLRSISAEQLQNYVTIRSREPGKRAQCVSVGTIKKELATFNSLWTWAAGHGYVAGAFPKSGLKYPKAEEKPPFQTWQCIERRIATGQLSHHGQQELWDSLYLSSSEITDLLEFIRTADAYPFIYPMCVMAAHTGARRSELCRSHAADFDLNACTVRIRERKRAKGKRTTRMVPLTSTLRDVIKAWLKQELTSTFTFPEDHRVKRTRKAQNEEGCVAPEEASHHLNQVLAGSKWENLKGWHIFRHSFISNCASKAIDQRLIDSWVGHQTDEMRRRYTHLFPSIQLQAIQQVFP